MKLTVRVADVVGSQDARRRVVAVLVDEVDGDRAAGAASMLAQGVYQLLNLSQVEGSTLGEEADTTSAEGSLGGEADLAADAINLGPGASTNGDLGLGTDADDVVTAVVGGAVVLVRGSEDVVPKLHDVRAGVVLDRGERAEARSTTVDAQSTRVQGVGRVARHVRGKSKSSGKEARESKEGLHGDG